MLIPLAYARGMKHLAICNISALEIYRASGRLLPDLLEHPRTSKLDDCGVPPRAFLSDEMARLGATSHPYHLLVPNNSHRNHRDEVRCHAISRQLPPRSLIALREDVLVSSPELLFTELAAEKDMDEVDLALLGYELCGTYLLDSSWDGLTHTDTPCCSKQNIQRIINHSAGIRGIGKAQRTLDLVHDASNSPMESILCALFTFPRSMGGLGIRGVELNGPVSTPLGPRHVDVLFRALSVGLEYKGKKYHSIQQAARDDRRQNSIVGTGVHILNVWYEDLVQQHLFKQLINSFERVAKLRIRIRSPQFEKRQNLLRVQLMPRIERYGDIIL